MIAAFMMHLGIPCQSKKQSLKLVLPEGASWKHGEACTRFFLSTKPIWT